MSQEPVKIELTLNARKSVLDNIECIDVINKDYLDKIINSTLIEDTEEWDETNQLKKIQLKLKNTIYLKVIYTRTKGMSFGRVCPKQNLSLSNVRREIRHTICKTKDNNNYYYDIDIENCHYNIISQVCKSNGIKCEKIDNYINNREKTLNKVMKEMNIERDMAKRLFIILIYGGSLNKFLTDNKINIKESKLYNELKELYNELNNIKTIIVNSNKDVCYEVERNKIIKGQEDYNYEASVFSIFNQEYEHRILECIYLYLKKNNIIQQNKCTLCADGLMIPRQNINDINKLLKDLESVIENCTGFKLKLTHKEMNEDLLDKLEKEQIKKEIDIDSYQYKKIEFEKNNFKIMHPISFGTINNGELKIRNKTDFITAYENINFLKKKITNIGVIEEKKSFINEWLKDENMRTYEYIDFLPKQEVPNNVYNTFNGFEVEKQQIKKELDIKESLIYKHLQNLCGNDEKVFDYVMMVLSRKVKNPSQLTNTALIFKSIQGTGKDTFFDWFGNNILGSTYYFNNTKPSLLFGNFNPDMENKLICVINEVSYKETTDLVEHIKGAITAKYNEINNKGLKIYKNKNHITYIFFTNNDNPIKIDINDRRYLAIKCNDEIANNNEYFTALIAEIKSKIYDRLFYEYLLKLDSDDYDFTNNRPETEFNKDLKEHSIPVIAKFLENLIFEKDKKIEQEYTAIELFDKFNDYLNANRIKLELNSTLFGIQLKKYTTIIKKRTNKGNKYNINYDDLENQLIQFKYMEPIPKVKRII